MVTSVGQMLSDALRREGGYTDNPSDSGNWFKGKLVGTNYGITGATLAAYLRRDVTEADVRAMSADTARAIYSANYLAGPGINRLPDAVQLLFGVEHWPAPRCRRYRA